MSYAIGNVLDVLPTLEAERFQCFVTSPPHRTRWIDGRARRRAAREGSGSTRRRRDWQALDVGSRRPQAQGPVHLAAGHARADGKWSITHSIEVQR